MTVGGRSGSAVSWSVPLLMGGLLTVLITAGCSSTAVDVSGDGSQVAVSHRGDVWIADVERESWRRAPLQGSHGAFPCWSPDGRYVLFEVWSQAGEAEEPERAQGNVPPPAALIDTWSETTFRLAPGSVAPFAWQGDSNGFAAVVMGEDGVSISHFGLDGGIQRTVPLPSSIRPARHLSWLPGTEDMAFIAYTPASGCELFRTDGAEIRQLSSASDIVGIGVHEKGGSLVWARSVGGTGETRLALYSYDPRTDATRRWNFPGALPFGRPERGVAQTMASVVFASNFKRMAIVLQSEASDRAGRNSATLSACYSMELDASAWRLIRLSEAPLNVAWSRDGRRLVILDSSDSEPRLFVYNYDGTGKRMSPPPELASPRG